MILLVVLLATAIFATSPIPTQAITIVATSEKGSIVRSESIPTNSQLFGDEEEVLASISTFNGYSLLLFI